MSLYPPIPEEGVAEVLSAWGGRGCIWEALAVPNEIQSERKWNHTDIKSRAHRILLERAIPLIRQWPNSIRSWLDALPAAQSFSKATWTAPMSNVSWPETKRLYGWPPVAFVGRKRVKGANTLLATSLRWTVEYLAVVHSNATRLFPDVDIEVREIIEVSRSL